jgi:hypothetical protein
VEVHVVLDALVLQPADDRGDGPACHGNVLPVVGLGGPVTGSLRWWLHAPRDFVTTL